MAGSEGAKPSFSETTARLDEIVALVRDGKTPLDECLDLLDEAVALGTRASELVDVPADDEDVGAPQ